MNSQPPQPKQLPPVEVVPDNPYGSPHAPYAPGVHPGTGLGDDAGMRMLLPVGRSGFAIAAGYLGLLSPLLIFAPFAILFGLLAIRDIKKSKETPHPKHGMGRAIFGIVMGIAAPLVVILVFANQ